MNTSTSPGTTGLVMNEGLLWERGKKGKSAFSLPRRDVDPAPLDSELTRESLPLPDLSELDVVRHYTRLSQWNIGVDTSMYPLGSCTMKYNPKMNERQAALPGFQNTHPLAGSEHTQGALEIISHLEELLAEITGLPAVTLQPAAGAHGEYAGMRIFQAYFHKKGETRNKILIPDSAHGTNPASAAMCGFKAVTVKSGDNGVMLPASIREQMDENTAGIMVTNPNTLGLFEEHIREIAGIVHDNGGLVYCDGANMNAFMGIVNMQDIGTDILHLNLHKTFSTPHGGGGPGSGPVCVTGELEPFLPVPRVVRDKERYTFSEDYPDSIGRLHCFYGNFGVMIKACSYILSMGPELKRVSQLAVLNANYLKEKLKDILYLPYDRPCMHECVFTDRIQEQYGVNTLDIAKRLIDYGYHPPTIYFPQVVNGAMLTEPTECESRETLDQFIWAVTRIAREAENNPELLKSAPQSTKIKRLDETAAARHPCLIGNLQEGGGNV